MEDDDEDTLVEEEEDTVVEEEDTVVEEEEDTVEEEEEEDTVVEEDDEDNIENHFSELITNNLDSEILDINISEVIFEPLELNMTDSLQILLDKIDEKDNKIVEIRLNHPSDLIELINKSELIIGNNVTIYVNNSKIDAEMFNSLKKLFIDKSKTEIYESISTQTELV